MNLLRRTSEYNLAGLLADHVDRRHDEEAGDVREDRGVDDPQSARPVDTEGAVDHRHRVRPRPHLAGAGGMVAPGFVLDELPDLVPRPHLLAGDYLPQGHAA